MEAGLWFAVAFGAHFVIACLCFLADDNKNTRMNALHWFGNLWLFIFGVIAFIAAIAFGITNHLWPFNQ